MITKLDIYPLLLNELPSMKAHLQLASDFKSPYQALRCLMAYTIETLKDGADRQSGKCLSLAEKIFQDGDGYVRNALELVYLEGIKPSLEQYQPLMVQHAPVLMSCFNIRISRKKQKSYLSRS